MPYEYEERRVTIEIEVIARAHIETGGGYDDEPPWAEIQSIEIDYIDIGTDRVMTAAQLKPFIIAAAYLEFEE